MDIVIRPFGIGVSIPEEHWKPKYEALKETAKETCTQARAGATPYLVIGAAAASRVIANATTDVGEWLRTDVHNGVQQVGTVLASHVRRAGEIVLQKAYELSDYHDYLMQKKGGDE